MDQLADRHEHPADMEKQLPTFHVVLLCDALYSRSCRLDVQRKQRQGLTLVEMLVVVAVTVVFMLALTQVFAMLGDGISSGKSVIEMNSEVRAVTSILQNDLDGITVTTLPWTSQQAGAGYLEIIEGVNQDYQALERSDREDHRFGDFDDAIMFTARARGTPFVGRMFGNPTPIQSEFAEIIFWPTFDDLDNDGLPDANERLTLHRRVLLIRPDIVLNGDFAEDESSQFFRHNDISAHFDKAHDPPKMITNSLADLTKRENRYAHVGNFPYEVNPAHFTAQATYPMNFGPLSNENGDIRTGEDVFVSRLLAFDVRVYDPRAPIYPDTNNKYALVPGDREWNDQHNSKIAVIGYGAYVDLGHFSGAGADYFTISPAYDPNPPDRDFFARLPHPKSQLVKPTYDTWSFHYEHDGQDQNGNSVVDEGVNSVDDDGNFGVDDIGERETSPPYPVPLRGLQIRLRVYEPDSQTVRQVTVAADFVSE